eukprot:213768-Amphidinium_carterae.1
MLWEASQALKSFSDIASSLLQPERLVVAALLARSVGQDSAPVGMSQQGSQLRGALTDRVLPVGPPNVRCGPFVLC